MTTRRFLVTAALPYSNGRLHVGHIAGAYLPADTFVRYLRATGADVRFICGSDDNGVAALKTAREQNRPVEELTAFYHRSQQRDFQGLGIVFDIYGGTHQPDYVRIHERFSQDLFLTIHDKGYFTKRKTKQLYDVEAGQFLPDRFVRGTCPHCGSEHAFGDQCEGCGRAIDQVSLIDPVSMMTGTRPELRETVHWYLRLDRLAPRLKEWLQQKRDATPPWRPTVLNQSLGRIENEGLPERAMTRDLTWGVPVPLDDPDARGKSLYVWFDAPIGYVSFTAALCERLGEGIDAYARWWKEPDCKIVHFIGEDNIVFHAITWPAMLLASHDSASLQGEPGEYQLPHNVVANSFMNIKFPGQEEEKISKSRGTAVWIEDYLKLCDPDPLRYYLTAVAPESARTTFDLDDFIARNNGELLNALGNFFNRTVTFVHKYFDGRVPPPGAREDVDAEQLARCRQAVEKTGERLERCEFKAALAEVMALARAGNGYFDVTKPFLSRKTDMDACGRAVNVCCQTARTLTTLIAPFLPFTAERCAAMLRLPETWRTWSAATDELSEGHPLDRPEILIKKLDPAELFGETAET
ncbi:MAG: methionine--tRNA ligase [Planctomycetota bacterium]|nr:MAG: methionine--tRNA ligase [Planctomycetota bacterium]